MFPSQSQELLRTKLHLMHAIHRFDKHLFQDDVWAVRKFCNGLPWVIESMEHHVMKYGGFPDKNAVADATVAQAHICDTPAARANRDLAIALHSHYANLHAACFSGWNTHNSVKCREHQTDWYSAINGCSDDYLLRDLLKLFSLPH